jgi:DNA-binding HxlR family transcriptional regulator
LIAGDLEFDKLQELNDLVRGIWEAGVLYCLLGGPRRYTDIGSWLATWSGLRPTDSAITRATKGLIRGGFVARTSNGSEDRRGVYALTVQGRERAAKIAALVAVLDQHE